MGGPVEAPHLDEAARQLAEARLAGRRLSGLPPEARPADLPEAYAAQDRLHERLAAAGAGRLAGHKIGCTTPVMQAYLRIDTPCGGGILDADVAHGRAERPHARYRRVGVECEVAVRLGADLSAAAAPFGRATVAAAVDAVMAAIEVVDDRWTDYQAVDTPTLVADDFFAAGCVLGEPRADWRGLDLAALSGTMAINGARVGEGRGADVLGHPLEALAWLANNQAARGRGLRAGEFVLLGSLVTTRWLARGDEAVIEVSELGRAALRLT
jgi:2-oxo-3-hexenedioate decarboxylase/2-keto-4-pentenoate hydratase